MNKKQDYNETLMKMFYEERLTLPEILIKLNKARAKVGLKPVKYNSLFQQVKRISPKYLKNKNAKTK